MIGLNEKDIDAIAMLKPATANNNKIDVQAYIDRAHYERSAYLTEAIAKVYNALKGKIAKSRANAKAIAQLQNMSGRELSDLGVARSEIRIAVMGDAAFRKPLLSKLATLVAPLVKSYEDWRSRREGYAQLMAMDARQLSDIGLTRGDIEAAVAGKGALANDNAVPAANNNDGRQAS
ncbi:MAG: DUF1127 domain-containing protein [Sneathiellales bacterium]|nr:DUF1127 domain-containing protein [Sneathiellales bacterium]